ncbi:extracellular solute-binding protein [Paenibacillus sp. MWE-103]|uniref:Extracellular solute-binding protein n=1 Tax=Paenibacillus artemisiicola TaxID=1172618 RepID=A0ABS3WB80_9BACL|nr:extracellular solute-binding protein [Paenibacillus artemisiicola]MBO7745576.1 extracellular solute-binding protein [Paenibacillus artemisiicola]
MRRKQAVMSLLAAALMIGTAACSGGNDGGNNAGDNGNGANQTGNAGADSGTIDVQFGSGADPNAEFMAKLQKKTGETWEDNRWTRLYKEKLGVVTHYKMMYPYADYNTQLKLAITSGDLPDIFPVNDKADLKQLAEGGAIADMGPVYDKYASPLLKSIIEAETKSIFDPVTFGGKIYGIPQKMPSTNGYSHLWIREDWLKKLNLERPKTMDDVYAVAQAFAKQDPDGNGKADTIGLGLNKDVLYSTRGLFWGFGAYPDFWLQDAGGKAQYGTVLPEMKQPLELLARMYKEGLLDKEFGTKDESKEMESAVAGKMGMFYGPHWLAYSVEKTSENDKNAKWIAIPLPGEGGNPVHIPLDNATDGYLIANKNFPHPELIVEMLNLYVDTMFGETNRFEEFWSDGDIDSLWNMGPVHALMPSLDLVGHQDIKQAVADNATDQLRGVAKGFYKSMQDGVVGMSMMFGPTDTPFAFVDQSYPDDVIWSAYSGAPTPTMVGSWSSMGELEATAMTAMIQGKEDVASGFDKFVDSWNKLGGKQVVEEVNAPQ